MAQHAPCLSPWPAVPCQPCMLPGGQKQDLSCWHSPASLPAFPFAMPTTGSGQPTDTSLSAPFQVSHLAAGPCRTPAPVSTTCFFLAARAPMLCWGARFSHGGRVAFPIARLCRGSISEPFSTMQGQHICRCLSAVCSGHLQSSLGRLCWMRT